MKRVLILFAALLLIGCREPYTTIVKKRMVNYSYYFILGKGVIACPDKYVGPRKEIQVDSLTYYHYRVGDAYVQ